MNFMCSMQSILKDICDKKGIKFTLVSNGLLSILEKEGKTRYLIGTKFDLNNHVVGNICDDKYALYSVLDYFKIPVAEHLLINRNYNKEEIMRFWKNNNFNVVVKSNIGKCGNDMYHVTNEKELFEKINELLDRFYSISISPYYEIENEYRTIILNGKVELIYGKIKPVIVGDGKRSIYELLCEFNPIYFKNRKEVLGFDKILNIGESYEYNWQFNLSKGSMPFIPDDVELINNIKALALKVVETVNLKFVSVDIIKLNTGELLVLEVNSGVTLSHFIQLIENGKNIAIEIYSKVIDEMFK